MMENVKFKKFIEELKDAFPSLEEANIGARVEWEREQIVSIIDKLARKYLKQSEAG